MIFTNAKDFNSQSFHELSYTPGWLLCSLEFHQEPFTMINWKFHWTDDRFILPFLSPSNYSWTLSLSLKFRWTMALSTSKLFAIHVKADFCVFKIFQKWIGARRINNVVMQKLGKARVFINMKLLLIPIFVAPWKPPENPDFPFSKWNESFSLRAFLNCNKIEWLFHLNADVALMLWVFVNSNFIAHSNIR